MPDPRLIERVAEDLGTSPGLVEKDWQVVRALAAIAAIDSDGTVPVFSGGTSLSKGWELIKRFSEDIDFKIAAPAVTSDSAARRARGAYRDRLVAALLDDGFELEGNVDSSNGNRFFAVDLNYDAQFGPGPGLRPHIRIEASFRAAALAPVARPIRSMVAAAQREPAEVAAFPCIDPVETGADKMSALAWRVRTRQRGAPRDDPAIIRHLHDLAALQGVLAGTPDFRRLTLAAIEGDLGRGGEKAPPVDPVAIFGDMLERLRTDPLWAREYDDFVRAVSFAPAGELIGFEQALAIAAELAREIAGA